MAGYADLSAKLAVEGSGTAKNAFDSFASAAASLDKQVYALSGGFVTLGKNFTMTVDVFNVAKTAFGAVTSSIMAVGNAIADTIKFGAGIASQFEQIGVKFDTVFGSGAPADKALAWAREFGAKTPMTLDEVTGRMIKLKNAGFDPLDGSLKIMEKLGDTTYALGVEFDRVLNPLMKMNMTGKVTGETVLQLAEAGIPVYEILADKFGLTADQMGKIAEQGLNGKEVALALADAMGNKYAGAMEKAANTAEGAWSTITDLANEAVLSITDQGPWDQFVGFMIDARDELEKFLDAEQWRSFAESAAGAIGGIVKYVRDNMYVLTDIGRAILGISTAMIDGTRWAASWAEAILHPLGGDITADAEQQLLRFQKQYDDFMAEADRKKLQPITPEIVDEFSSNMTEISAEAKKQSDEVRKYVEAEAKKEVAAQKQQRAEKNRLDREAVKEFEKIQKDAEKTQIETFKAAMAEKRKGMEFQAKMEKDYYDYRNRLADISYKFEQDRAMTAYKRMFEDRERMMTRSEEDLMMALQDIDKKYEGATFDMSAIDRKGQLEKYFRDMGYSMFDAMMMAGDLGEDQKKLERFLEDQRIKRKREQEDAEKELRRQQEEQQVKRDFLQKRQSEIMAENTKRMIEMATSMDNFKLSMEQVVLKPVKLKILDQTEFVAKFMEDVFKRAGVLARAEAIQIAGY